MDKSTGKKQHTPNFIPKKNNKYHHGLLPTKRPRPAATEGANKRRITTSSGVDEDIRLVLESAATDSELAVKIHGVKAELQAVDGALGDEGSSYLGIVDKGELEKRRQLLEKRFRLLKEERELLQTLRVQLAEEERSERTEPRAPSSLAPRRSSSNSYGNPAAAAAAAAAAAPPQQSSPSLRIQAPASPTSPPAMTRTFSYPLSPAASRGDASSIGDFLKRNSAAVEKKKKLAGAAAGRSDAAGHGS